MYISVNGQHGRTTRYWDCCVASCSWKENVLASHPVNTCEKDGVTYISNFNYLRGNVCDNKPNGGYMCNDNQPWALTDNLSYGFAAASFTSGKQNEWCCSCYRLQFTNTAIKGKQMVVQVTNTGYDLSNNHFDIQMPGGGVGVFNGCKSQWNTGEDGWGKRYGGVESVAECDQLPPVLQDACKWRFNWYKNADNPEMDFERVQCPKELTDITGCVPIDDANQKKLPWVN
ncbi:glycoside hydrolase family 45 protein [Piromyces sp. E2]|nr:glycoside hydrolase family 45 protein [Piromyces sp. E2]|eukprot:OUM62864.1 glycoside hydrolase family 45 protein [Piromyces sp. E2]